jgi:hypothetical protein
MDLSKLPKLSQTPAPPDQASSPPAAAGADVVPPPAVATSAYTAWCRECHAPNLPGSRFCAGCGGKLKSDSESPLGVAMGAEVWISAALGLLFMLLGKSFGGWLIARATGKPYDTGYTWQPGTPLAGQPVEYWDLQGFAALSDSAIFLFGLAMVFEAVALAVVYSRLRAKRPILVLAMAVAFAATAHNLVVSLKMLGAGLMPLMSLFAVAFGGYILACEWRLFPETRRQQRA